MRTISEGFVWLLFFASTVLGHVGMKLAVAEGVTGFNKSLLEALCTPWGAAALVSWTASALIWALILSSQPLLDASSISSLRYIFIVLAAWLLLNESMSYSRGLGVVLIFVGIYFVTQGRA